MRLTDSECVRIEFNDADYEALRAFASEHDVTVEEAVRAALDGFEPAPDEESEGVATDMRELESKVEEWREGDGMSTPVEDL